ncbi:alanyl-tRNA editing protein [Spirochaeta africana]|uniref:alanyl-tRNA editing protein n=1 Tax=Spirochaeta africana TaxID=46355 RepID=UPI00145D3567|nr:alanyl-tRNA editing protein [Spirochaeta africana]
MSAQRTPQMLFYDNQYLKTSTARVVAARAVDAAVAVLELDQTLFYPEGGGQPADRGTIAGMELLDVQKGEDGAVLHTVRVASDTLPAPGSEVRLELNWAHRFAYMQQHSGQHLLSAMLKRTADAGTVSVRQGSETTTIEVDREQLSADQLGQAVRAANAAIQQNLPITAEWVAHTRINQQELRRPTSITGQVRLVRIQDTDCVACAGVHLSSTGELGVIRLVGSERIRGRLRLQFLIGQRAVEEYLYLGEMASDLVQRFSTPVTQLHQQILQLEEKQLELKQELAALQLAQAETISRRIAANGPGELLQDGDPFPEVARQLGKLASTPRLVLAPATAGLRWAMVLPEGSREDVARFMDGFFAERWKGGGKPPLFQGVVAGVEAADPCVQHALAAFPGPAAAD